MKFVHIFIIASILFSFNSLKADDVKTENKIAKNLRCLICQGQSVYDSDSEFANSIKILNLILKLIIYLTLLLFNLIHFQMFTQLP